MLYIIKPIALLSLVIFLGMPIFLLAQNKCASIEVRQSFLDADDKWDIRKMAMENAISDWIQLAGERIQQRTVITIPVVVHIVYNNPVENISDEQIISQIDILNQDFRATNLEIPSIPVFFQPLIADVEFEFCLATIDPDGNATTGITRKFTNNPVGIGGTSAIHYTTQGGQNAWDTNRYLNIWVAKFAGGIGGIASFPGIGPPEEDGVEINYLQFGNINVTPPFHLGRTLTHEIGHYFNLEHPWGPELNDCCSDDFVADTPKACETYIGQCPTHPVVSCDQPDVFMNFMFYTNDDCMGMFTNGQKLRMWATLNTIRPGLLNNQACDPLQTGETTADVGLKVLSNPAHGQLIFEIEKGTFNQNHVKLIDINGRIFSQMNIRTGGLQTLDLRGIAPGLYFLVYENGQRHSIEKVVIMP